MRLIDFIFGEISELGKVLAINNKSPIWIFLSACMSKRGFFRNSHFFFSLSTIDTYEYKRKGNIFRLSLIDMTSPANVWLIGKRRGRESNLTVCVRLVPA